MRAIILGQGNPYLKNPYLSKLSQVFDSHNISYEFWIWSRDPNLPELAKVKVMLSFGSWGGGAINALGYLLWVAILTLRIFSRPRAGLYFCSRLDAALPCAIVSTLRRCDYVFLDRDKLSKSHAWPKIVKLIIERVEKFVGHKAKLHILPGISRVDRNDANNVRIVYNTPHTEVIERAQAIAKTILPKTGRLRVFISGLISPERGAQMMSAAFDQLVGHNIEFVAAGRLLGKDAKRLAEKLGPSYRGIVSNEQALAILLSCDVVLALYDPTLEINRLAEPNKWFDCAALQVPFVTNHGLITLAPFEEKQACFICEYGNVEELKELLLNLANNPGLIEARREGLRQLRFEAWDSSMSRIISECISLTKAN